MSTFEDRVSILQSRLANLKTWSWRLLLGSIGCVLILGRFQDPALNGNDAFSLTMGTLAGICFAGAVILGILALVTMFTRAD